MSTTPDLIHLPAEILLQIFKAKTLQRGDLCSLSLSARRLNNLVTPLIYRHLFLGKSESPKRLAALADAVECHSRLGALIEGTDLAIVGIGRGSDEFRRELRQSTTLIQLNFLSVLCRNALNLNRLCIGNLSIDSFGTQYADVITTEAMINLHTLRLWGLPTHKEHILKILSLPKLRNLTVANLKDNCRFRPESLLPKTPKDTACQLDNLVLGPNVDIGYDLVELLYCHLKLARLRFNVGQYQAEYISNFTEDLPLYTLSEVLHPMSDTVVFLKLEGYQSDHLHEARVDFCYFANLRSLKITQSLLFPTVYANSMQRYIEPESRNGLYHRLPRSLQKLTIFFAPGTAIMDRLYRPPDHYYVEEDYDWIEELALHRESSLPELRKIKITEHSSCVWVENEHIISETKSWDVPVGMREFFDKQNVELLVLVRKSYQMQTEDDDEDGFFFIPSPKR